MPMAKPLPRLCCIHVFTLEFSCLKLLQPEHVRCLLFERDKTITHLVEGAVYKKTNALLLSIRRATIVERMWGHTTYECIAVKQFATLAACARRVPATHMHIKNSFQVSCGACGNFV